MTNKLIKKMNEYYGCEYIVKDKPEANKVYKLTGGHGEKCIANGNTWKESEVKDGKENN